MIRSMTPSMTKVAPLWRKAAATAAMVIGMAGSGPARAFAPAQPVSPPAPAKQADATAPAQPAAVPQPGYPPSATPSSSPVPANPSYPPQYPPPPPGYPQGDARSSSATQQPYPPAGYPQQYPPPGYPPQYPPPGYPQQYPEQGYPQQYPPSSYPQLPYGQPGYPPPGYAPPPGYPVPPPPPPPSTRPHGHGALLLMPYLGVQANEGATGSDQNVGFRMGGLIGYRANGQFSLNAELTIDVLNLKNGPPGVDLSGGAVDLAFSPLLHFDAGSLELAIGPKLGIGATIVTANQAGIRDQSTTSGFVYGVNAGAFLPLGNGASLGLLLSFQVRTVSEYCQKPDGGSDMCVGVSNANSDKILGVTGAALF